MSLEGMFCKYKVMHPEKNTLNQVCIVLNSNLKIMHAEEKNTELLILQH